MNSGTRDKPLSRSLSEAWRDTNGDFLQSPRPIGWLIGFLRQVDNGTDLKDDDAESKRCNDRTNICCAADSPRPRTSRIKGKDTKKKDNWNKSEQKGGKKWDGETNVL
jgi:hypothetical protein